MTSLPTRPTIRPEQTTEERLQEYFVLEGSIVPFALRDPDLERPYRKPDYNPQQRTKTQKP
tara:strand:+ start:8991 stop:9173 length:183 start_codon:yes stop_codon:yes gene_type:complete